MLCPPFFNFRCNFDPFSNLRRDNLSSGFVFPSRETGSEIHSLFYHPLSFDQFSLMLDTGGGSGGGLALD